MEPTSMRERLRALVAMAGLARAELAAAAIGNGWLLLMLGFALERERLEPRVADLGLGGSLLLSAVMSVGVVVCGMALNDVLDAKHDRAFAPNRAIPSGRVPQWVAVTVAMVSLLVGLGAATALGEVSTVAAMLAAGGVLFYNVVGRYVPAVGSVTLGLVTGVLMLAAHPGTRLTWPVVAAMTLAMAGAALRHAVGGRRPAWRSVDTWLALAGWGFWTLLIVTLTRAGLPASPPAAGTGLWVGPAIAAGGYVAALVALVGPRRGDRSDRRLARRIAWVSGWWLLLLAAGWLLSAGLWWQGCLMLLLAGASAAWGWLMRRAEHLLTRRPVSFGLPGEPHPPLTHPRQGRGTAASCETHG